LQVAGHDGYATVNNNFECNLKACDGSHDIIQDMNVKMRGPGNILSEVNVRQDVHSVASHADNRHSQCEADDVSSCDASCSNVSLTEITENPQYNTETLLEILDNHLSGESCGDENANAGTTYETSVCILTENQQYNAETLLEVLDCHLSGESCGDENANAGTTYETSSQNVVAGGFPSTPMQGSPQDNRVPTAIAHDLKLADEINLSLPVREAEQQMVSLYVTSPSQNTAEGGKSQLLPRVIENFEEHNSPPQSLASGYYGQQLPWIQMPTAWQVSSHQQTLPNGSLFQEMSERMNMIPISVRLTAELGSAGSVNVRRPGAASASTSTTNQVYRFTFLVVVENLIR
jgi:hypothetical protein